MNFHIFKFFAFVFVLMVLVLKPISAKPQLPQAPQVPQVPMPSPDQMANAASSGIEMGKGFAQMGMDHIPSPQKK